MKRYVKWMSQEHPMPVFVLDTALDFPPVELAGPPGLLAVGGDLNVDRLLAAYSRGIFPWYSQGEPIMWWSPDPRLILKPDELKISKSLKRTLKKDVFTTTLNRAFPAVIQRCRSKPRPGQDGTWITPEMQAAYIRLHEAGYAESVEVWRGTDLVGGLYGVAIGRVFFGESMFSDVSDASKVGLVALVEELKRRGVPLIDCQVSSDHLKRLGAKEITRAEFTTRLRELAPILPPQPRLPGSEGHTK